MSGKRAEAVQGSQVPRSVLSRERLLVFRGDTGLGGLLGLELLEAVECLGESESWRAQRETVRSTGQEGLERPRAPSSHPDEGAWWDSSVVRIKPLPGQSKKH